MRYVSTILSVIAILLAVWVLVKLNNLEKDLVIVPEGIDPAGEEVIEIEVADYMSKVQLYVNKMYFAGKSENKALFNFYVTETNEVMKEVADANVVDKGVNVSENIKAFGLQSLQVLQKRIEEEGFKNFEQHYQNLVTSCNSCHKISQRPFIVITKPVKPALDNQDFSKGEWSDAEVDMDGD
jgi:hypothetical protein